MNTIMKISNVLERFINKLNNKLKIHLIYILID